MDEFFRRGWAAFDAEPTLADWAAHADAAALKAERASENAEWLRCGGTWFVGVNALANDPSGQILGGPPLIGAALRAADRIAAGGRAPLDRAQASVCYTGYPQPGGEESSAAFAFRRDRDGAHVDGLHRIMPGRRRQLKERHAFVLGLPLNNAPDGAAPLVVWEGSHEVMRAAFRAAYAGIPPDEWGEVDVTEAYQAARRICFDTLPRVEISAKPGGAYLMHRLALHGVAPWGDAAPGRRAVAYFRPEIAAGAGSDLWLTAA